MTLDLCLKWNLLLVDDAKRLEPTHFMYTDVLGASVSVLLDHCRLNGSQTR